ncbi:hypothetical protein AQUCO_04100029v1 [Aquilegia coerulea]|uniref:F-box domain-containing protein n=1 Tax=Aquilegia coerulea TaxID=218851 RepID=A0A2G5CPZ4_AQUCA|nr:hypothetical protein AQUCO_04100029v1 [Aquilegia coerulea]
MADDMTKKSLPFEAVMEIISWLPVKSLIRFRCISKTWHRLLTIDPQFAKLQLDRSIESKVNSSILILGRKNGHAESNLYSINEFPTSDEPILLESPSISIIGVCNGLILLSSRLNEDADRVLYVWNPITGEYISIPCTPTPTLYPNRRKNTRFAFGFHQAINQYKIIRTVGEDDRNSEEEGDEVVEMAELPD